MRRRTFLGSAVAGCAGLVGLTATPSLNLAGSGAAWAAPSGTFTIPSDHPLRAVWALWKARFLQGSGRVYDASQKSVSHSEGQGYGMALATYFADRPAFEAMLNWTQNNLAIRGDSLLAWRFLPDSEPNVPDLNNASDGDMFFAWALVRAADIWARPDWLDRAMRTVADLTVACLRTVRFQGVDLTVMLPGAKGFERNGTAVLNLSYCMPRAMTELAKTCNAPLMAAAGAGMTEIMERVSAQRLVPDWLQIADDTYAAATPLSYDTGYDALRVPLYLLWSGYSGSRTQRLFQEAANRESKNYLTSPTIIDATTLKAREYSPDAGYRAIAALNNCALARLPGSTMPAYDPIQPYFPATLHLMSLVVQAELFPICTPI